ncbi:MAG: tetratricopeptide repeat protein [Bdellovibrionota bacterium]
MPDQLEAEGRINLLNVGTKILLKDTMDQYVRTLGDYKTFYAPTMGSALRAYKENPIQLIISEIDLGDGSAYRLVQSLGGTADDDLYVILALEERSPILLALAEEIEAHSILVKPFAAADIKAQLEKYKAWRAMPKEPWRLLLREAHLAVREKKFREAEENFKSAIASAPTNPIALFKVGQYYLTKPDYPVAETLLKKAVSLKPDYTRAIWALGSLYLARHDLDKAEECFKKAHSISPLNPDRLVEMVRLYIERCVDLCKDCLRLDPAAPMARHNLGKLFAFQKDYVATVRELEKTLPSLQGELKTEAQTFVALARKLGSLAK